VPSQTPGRRPQPRKLGRHENPRVAQQPLPSTTASLAKKVVSNRRRREPVAISIQLKKKKKNRDEQLEMAGCEMGGGHGHSSSREQVLPKKETSIQQPRKSPQARYRPRPHLRDTIPPSRRKHDGLQGSTSPARLQAGDPSRENWVAMRTPELHSSQAPLRLNPCRQLQRRWQKKNVSNRRRREPVAISIQLKKKKKKKKKIVTSSW